MQGACRFVSVLLWIVSLGAAFASAPAENIVLPPETAKLKPSDLPGYQLALQKCGICHSADYINLQPPDMTTAQWTAGMAKMQHTYGAPITDADIAAIGEYLGVTYGGQELAKIADSTPGSAAGGVNAARAGATDATSLLNSNACLSCHSVDKQVVGPAHKAVAEKYKGDPDALGKIEASIHSGGSGK